MAKGRKAHDWSYNGPAQVQNDKGRIGGRVLEPMRRLIVDFRPGADKIGFVVKF